MKTVTDFTVTVTLPTALKSLALAWPMDALSECCLVVAAAVVDVIDVLLLLLLPACRLCRRPSSPPHSCFSFLFSSSPWSFSSSVSTSPFSSLSSSFSSSFFSSFSYQDKQYKGHRVRAAYLDGNRESGRKINRHRNHRGHVWEEDTGCVQLTWTGIVRVEERSIDTETTEGTCGRREKTWGEVEVKKERCGNEEKTCISANIVISEEGKRNEADEPER